MRSLFKRLNVRGIPVDISTFSKASKKRDTQVFYNLFIQLRKQLERVHDSKESQLTLFPIDSTIVTLTSKLLWSQGIRQVKLLAGINLLTDEPEGVVIHFGEGHDSKQGKETIDSTPENGVSILDRGFSSLARITDLMKEDKRYFVLRIKNNIKIKMQEDGQCLWRVAKEKTRVRIVNFCHLETGYEFRLATNLAEV